MIAGLLAGSAGAKEPLPEQVDFNRDIRPILSDHCFNCHGPDEADRQAELRLDLKEGAFADRGGYQIIVPGSPADSELYKRITDADADQRMPPADAERQLNQRQIALLGRWIEQGAKWQKHWSLLPPARPDLPEVRQKAWTRNAIDHFVLARLEKDGISPSPPADRARLLRRVTLDLTGLPPTPEEVDAFVADRSPAAYRRAVDRLLASPRFGERMAVEWLDAARYADTSGYQTDGQRHMWRWRDWVIDALNRNQPFDQFTIEQVAGDLLDNPTLSQQIATGFHRNHRANSEGGIVLEEYLAEYAADRVETTCTVWLGLTMGCARCHDHKYDALTQRDYYRMFAYFNNVPERGRVIKYGNAVPYIRAPSPQQQDRLSELDRQLKQAEEHWQSLQQNVIAAQQAWEQSADTTSADDWTETANLDAHYPFDGQLANAAANAAADAGKDKSKLIDGKPAYAAGVWDRAIELDGRSLVDCGKILQFAGNDKFSLGAWVRLDQGSGPIASHTEDGDRGGFSLHVSEGRVGVSMGPRWLDDCLRVESGPVVQPKRWHHVMFTYDGSQFARGLRIYVDGRREQTRVLVDMLTGGYQTDKPFRIGAQGTSLRLQGGIDELRFYGRTLSDEEVRVLACRESVAEILSMDPDRRDENQREKLKACFLDRAAPQPIRAAQEQVEKLRRRRSQYFESIPTTMVMRDRPQKMPAYILARGEYDKPGEPVDPGVPASLPPLPEGVSSDRLALARWLVSSDNPLTARVIVNRYWQMYFGHGLVKTAEDFGSQGEWPSHPQLLDWLATEFVRSGWNVKRMQKLIVTSATYRQSSRVGSPQLLQRDPENRLLARGPRLRLPAEMIRDQALAASGLLVGRIGGPSVRPYQPEGLWREIASQSYHQDSGADLYRRSMYTFWKRTVPPPTMSTFDGPSRETCIVRRARTNTPLQALALMNDVTYVEAARHLAERVMHQAHSRDERLLRTFRLVLGRQPQPAEMQILQDSFTALEEQFRKRPAAAKKLLSQGETPVEPKLPAAKLAAHAAIASLVLNLDEAVMKE